MILYDQTDLYTAYKAHDEILLFGDTGKLIAQININGKKFNCDSETSVSVIYFFIKECEVLFDSFGCCSEILKKNIINTIKSFSNIIKPIDIFYNGNKLNSSKETELFLKYYGEYGEFTFGEVR
jgi:hypothetical protein